MTTDNSRRYLPFVSSKQLGPTPEQLAAFLASRPTEAGEDLALFRALLTSIDAFEQKQLSATAQEDLQKHLFYGALHYTQFADHALLTAVELFHYQMHALTALDFDAPASFIQAAQATINKLSRKKIDDVTRMIRLKEMISEREKIIEKLTHSWEELAAELCRIALYIKDNLTTIEKRCEASIIMLSDRGVTGTKEAQLIEDIKTHFKDQLKKTLHANKITMQDIQNSLKEANLVAEELSIAFQEDMNTLTGLYEALHDHLKKTIQIIETLLAALERKKEKGLEEKKPLLVRLELTLASLLSVHRLEQQATGIHTETTHEKLVTQKRKEMLGFLFEVTQRERRRSTDRRTSGERRKFHDPNYHGPERRSGKDRRSGKNRREP